MQARHAVDQAADLAKHGCVGYIGAWASSPTIAVSEFLALKSINRAIIGPSAASSQLSKPKYRNFLRTGVSEEDPAKLTANLMTGSLIGQSLSKMHTAN